MNKVWVIAAAVAVAAAVIAGGLVPEGEAQDRVVDAQALANSSSVSSRVDRFQMEASGPNILRLDRATGEIASCSAGEDGAWSCETLVQSAVPFEPPIEGVVAPGGLQRATDETATEATLAEENARLSARVEALERRLAAVRRIVSGAGLPADGTNEPLAGRTLRERPFDLDQARRDIDQAVEITDYAVRSVRGLIEALGEDER